MLRYVKLFLHEILTKVNIKKSVLVLLVGQELMSLHDCVTRRAQSLEKYLIKLNKFFTFIPK